jgi:hypothetical protein
VGAINGVAATTEGQNLANITVQLRDLATNQVVGSTTTSATGQFSFVAVNPANYAVEMVNIAGEVAGSSAVTVTAGAVVSGVTVTAPAALVGAAAGAAGGAAAAGAGAGAGAAAGGAAAGGAAAAASTAVAVTSAAAAAGVAGAVAAATQASPSR